MVVVASQFKTTLYYFVQILVGIYLYISACIFTFDAKLVQNSKPVFAVQTFHSEKQAVQRNH